MGKITVLVCLFLFIGSVTAFSATINVPADYTTIQLAINNASDGDVISVSSGTHDGFTIQDGPRVYVESRDGARVTILDGYQNGEVVAFIDVEDGTGRLGIEGFTITNGTGHSDADICGGGIYCRSSSPKIKSNVITDNTAEYGGGIYCLRFEDGDDCSPIIEYNTISENIVEDDGIGGGICCRALDAQVIIRNNQILYNEADQDGGGIAILTDYNANGIDIALIEDNLISYNIADNNNQTYAGGGICTKGYGKIEIKENDILSNESGSGGGIALSKNSGCNDQDLVEMNIIAYNTGGDGGGVCLNSNRALLRDNMIYENEAVGDYTNGGGVYVGGTKARIFVNNTITKNTAGGTGSTGGGVYIDNGTYDTITNEIIWGNSATLVNELDDGGNSPTVSYSDVESNTTPGNSWPGNWNTWSNPQFMNPGGDNYHLTLSSANVRNSGNNGATGIPTRDFEGDDRIMGTIVDMGADEYYE